MAKRSSKIRRTGLLVVLALVAFVAAAAATYYATSIYQSKPKPGESGQVTAHPPVITEVPLGVRVVIYVPETDPEGSYLVPVSVTARKKGGRLDTALEALLRAGQSGGRAEGLIPEGTKLLAPIKVEDGVAEVNLSEAFLDNFNGSIEQEALTLNSIVYTLVSNSDGRVRRAQILVKGEKADTLGGHLELTDPIEASPAALKPKTK